MLTFIDFLINEVNGTNSIKQAISLIKRSFENPMRKRLNKIKKSINKSMIGNKVSKYNRNKLARMRTVQANASRIKRINNTITNNRVQI